MGRPEQETWGDRFGLRLDRWYDRAAAHPGLVLSGAALFLLLQISPWWYSSPDSACYLSIARSLGSPDGPRSLGNRFLFYPLGYPLILAPAFQTGPRPFVAIGGLQFLAALAVVTGVYRWSRSLGPRAALFCTLLTATHSCFCIYYRRPLSETAFLAGLVWTAVVLDRVRTATAASERWKFAAAGTLLLLVTCQIRPNGIMLAPGFAAALVWQAWRAGRGWGPALAAGMVVGVVASAAFLGTRALDDRRAAEDRGITYWDYLTKIQATGETVADRAIEGVRIQMLEFLRLTVPGVLKTHVAPQGWTNVNTWLSIGATLPLVVGWFRLFARRPDVMVWTVPFYLALNVMWAADQGGRYTLPLLPVIGAALWFVAAEGRPRAGRWMLLLLAAHFGVSAGYWLSVDLPRARAANLRRPDVDGLVERIDLGRDRVAIVGLPPEDWNLWRFSLDRQVYEWDQDSAAEPSEIRWIVESTTPRPAPADGESSPPAIPARFQLVAERGTYRLLRASE